MITQINHFINGKQVPGGTERSLPIFNPATGEQTGRVVAAGRAVVADAVSAASRAAQGWAETTPLRRARVLNRFLRILEDRTGELADVIVSEHGKVHSDALGEVQRGMEVVEFATAAPQLLKGELTENVGTHVDSYSTRQSLGVVAGITPFNFPVMVPMWMFPVALACGNAFILKPSERDPSASLVMAEWLKEAGLPDGVFTWCKATRRRSMRCCITRMFRRSASWAPRRSHSTSIRRPQTPENAVRPLVAPRTT